MSKRAIVFYGGFLHRAGGAFHHARTLEQELLRQGWQVTLVTLDALPVWCRYLPHLAERATNKFLAPLGFLHKGRVTKALYQHYFGNSVDLRVFEDVYFSWNSEVPSVTILHAVWSDNLHNLQSHSVSEAREREFREAEANSINEIAHPVITVSAPYRDYIVNEHFAGCLTKHVDVVELGIDQALYDRGPQMTPTSKSIVYVGALEARKKPMFLLEVFKRIYQIDSDYKLTILGDGPLYTLAKDFAVKHELPVAFLGRVDNRKVALELRRHEIYLHTSVKESFSYSLLEAKMAGLTTFAYSKLQIPPEFVDVGFDSFSIEQWSIGIRHHKNSSRTFDGRKYSAERMTTATLALLGRTSTGL